MDYIKRILFEHSELYKIIRYVVVGGCSWVVDILIFSCLLPFGGIVLSHTCSRIGGAIFGFFGQKFFSCQEMTRDAPTLGAQSIRYAMLLCISYLLSLGLLYLFNMVAGVAAIESKVMAEVVVLPFNYLVMSKLIFRKR